MFVKLYTYEAIESRRLVISPQALPIVPATRYSCPYHQRALVNKRKFDASATCSVCGLEDPKVKERLQSSLLDVFRKSAADVSIGDPIYRRDWSVVKLVDFAKAVVSPFQRPPKWGEYDPQLTTVRCREQR